MLPSRGVDLAERDDVAEHGRRRATWCEEGRGDRAQRDPGGGLAGAGALEDRPGVVEAVLLHADEVGVAGPRPGERGVAGQAGELRPRLTGSGAMTRLPLGPLGVADRGSRPGRPWSARGARRRGTRPRPARSSSARRGRSPGGAGPGSPRPSSVLVRTPAGRPSRIATSAGPCDSPAVNQRSMAPVSHGAASRDRRSAAGSLRCAGSQHRPGRGHRLLLPGRRVAWVVVGRRSGSARRVTLGYGVVAPVPAAGAARGTTRGTKGSLPAAGSRLGGTGSIRAAAPVGRRREMGAGVRKGSAATGSSVSIQNVVASSQHHPGADA